MLASNMDLTLRVFFCYHLLEIVCNEQVVFITCKP